MCRMILSLSISLEGSVLDFLYIDIYRGKRTVNRTIDNLVWLSVPSYVQTCLNLLGLAFAGLEAV